MCSRDSLKSVDIIALDDLSLDPPVRGFLHPPAIPGSDALVLTHGAGSDCHAPLLLALAGAWAAAGCSVLRCDLPFRQERRAGPMSEPSKERDRAGLRNAIAVMKKRVGGRVFLGGHSYGGRQASMLCAAEPDTASALLLLSYPLHPPRRPEKLRTEHLPNLRTPSLFVHGTRDPFGSIAELENALRLIPGKMELIRVEGAGHDLGFKGKARLDELPPRIVQALAALVETRKTSSSVCPE
jgi:predicted alpha/beta-hydrolase family hydrolase